MSRNLEPSFNRNYSFEQILIEENQKRKQIPKIQKPDSEYIDCGLVQNNQRLVELIEQRK